ncbi:hypothetical protein D030_0040B, partial [Vibrio parahaemolyticus AQ3810]
NIHITVQSVDNIDLMPTLFTRLF